MVGRPIIWVLKTSNLCDDDGVVQRQIAMGLVDGALQQTCAYGGLVLLTHSTEISQPGVSSVEEEARTYLDAVLRQYLSMPFFNWMMAR